MKKIIVSFVIVLLVGSVMQTSAMTAKQQAEARAAKKAREKAQAAKSMPLSAPVVSEPEAAQVGETSATVPEGSTLAPAEAEKPLSKVSLREMTDEEKAQVLAEAQAKETLADAQAYLALYKKNNPQIKVPKYYFDALLKVYFRDKERAQELSALQLEVDNAMNMANFAAGSVGTMRNALIPSASEQLDEVDKKLIDFGKRVHDDANLLQKVSDLQIKIQQKLKELHKPSIFGVRMLKTH